MKTIEAIKKRRSIRHYNPSFKISDKEIQELIEFAMLSPTSYNIQHWKFVVVTDTKLRAELKDAAYGQEQVADASALILVATDIKAWQKDMPQKWQNVSNEIKEFMVNRSKEFYQGNDELQRDEAIRSASFATQTLILAAISKGYDTGIMIGFDPEKVANLINLPANFMISNFVVIGKGMEQVHPRGGQTPIENVMIKDKF